MEDSKGIFCSLCSNSVNNGNFTIIDESTREILKTVSLNLNFDDNYKHVMCSSCSLKVYSAFDFKSTCLYVEDKIVSYVNPEVLYVDLREVYSMEHESKPSVKMEDDQKICRLCLQLAGEGFVTFYEVKLEIMQRYIPEVNFGITEDPVICRQCFDSLSLHDAFIKASLNVETKIPNVHDNKITDFEPCEMFFKSEMEESLLRDEQRMEELIKTEKEVETEESLIKTEEVDIKTEVNDWASDSPEHNLHNETIENKMMGTCGDVGEMEVECIRTCDTEVQINEHKAPSYKIQFKNGFNSGLNKEAAPGLINYKKGLTCPQLISKATSKARIYRCDMCEYKTNVQGRLSTHRLKHKNISEIEMYKCDTCTYETKHKRCLNTHKLLHKSPLEIQMYKCDTCSFETKFKSNLKSHQLKHKDSSEIQMYKCHICTFETKRKRGLQIHQLLHKDPSQIKMYKCDTCGYENKYKGHLKSHQLTHKSVSEVQMYKCDTCTYETKYKRCLIVHCETCSYETKYKSLKNHQITHENSSTTRKINTSNDNTVNEHYSESDLVVDKLSSEIEKQSSDIHDQNFSKEQMYSLYKCSKCVFQTEHKSSLVRHQLKHRDASEIQIYKCDICTFETKHKSNIKMHQLFHKDPSKIEMYKCDMCSYKSKHRGNLKNHKIVHKSVSEIPMYKCNTCAYESKYKNCLSRHKLRHKNPSEIQLYKCDTCDYETKYKCSLKSHQLTHENPPTTGKSKRNTRNHNKNRRYNLYKCDKCSFQTGHKRNIVRHQLTHTDSSEIQMYQCYTCTYKTKYKSSLIRHQSKHQNSSEIQLHKCGTCGYETKNKESLENHQLTHENPSTT